VKAYVKRLLAASYAIVLSTIPVGPDLYAGDGVYKALGRNFHSSDIMSREMAPEDCRARLMTFSIFLRLFRGLR